MRHGRDHEERQEVLRHKPYAVEEPDDEREAIAEEEAIADEESPLLPEELRASRGAEGGAIPAPTERAREREAERHERERGVGVVAAGTGVPRQRRAPEASRDEVERAACEADEAVTERYAAPPPDDDTKR